MRFVAGFLLLASLVIHLLLGGSYLLASSYQQIKADIKAETDAGDLSSVSGDLDVSKAELDRMHASGKAAKARAAGAGRREVLLGIGLLASAACQILALVLVLLRRARHLAMIVVGLALAGLVSIMAVDHFLRLGILNMRLGIIDAVALAVALGVVLARPAPRATTT